MKSFVTRVTVGNDVPPVSASSRLRCKGNSIDQNTYTDLVVNAIIKHGYSFSSVEHEGNREIHEYLSTDVQTVCRSTLESKCLRLYASLKPRLKDTLCSLPGRICLTAGVWTSCQTEDYLCVTAHYVDANWKSNSKVLSFSVIESQQTGESMSQVLLSLIAHWGIGHKIYSVTLDSACSNDKAVDYLKDTLNHSSKLLDGGQYFHVKCAAHFLNSVVEVGLKAIENIVFKIRESVKYVKASEARKSKFQSAVELAGIQVKTPLWFDVPTVWESTYMMLDRAVLHRNAFTQLELADVLYPYCPTSREWEMAESVCDILGPIYDISKLFSGSSYPTSNLYFEHMWRISMVLMELVQSPDNVIREMSVSMRKEMYEYWDWTGNDDCMTIFALAWILDPRCKLSLVEFCFKKLFNDELRASLKVNYLQAKLEMLLKAYTNTEPSPQKRKRKYDFTEDFEYEEEKIKLELYLKDARVDRKKELDVLDYWRRNERRYGKLAHLARDILSVPLTNVASGSTFSIGSELLKEWKNSYIPDNVEALITTRSWLCDNESTKEDKFMGLEVDFN